jgi:hypothetical protein
VSAELGVRSLRVLAGTISPAFSIGDMGLRRNRSVRASVQLSVTHGNSATDSLWVSQITRVLYVNLTPRARAGVLSRMCGPTWARFSPILFIIFTFLFLPDLGNS